MLEARGCDQGIPVAAGVPLTTARTLLAVSGRERQSVHVYVLEAGDAGSRPVGRPHQRRSQRHRRGPVPPSLRRRLCRARTGRRRSPAARLHVSAAGFLRPVRAEPRQPSERPAVGRPPAFAHLGPESGHPGPEVRLHPDGDQRRPGADVGREPERPVAGRRPPGGGHRLPGCLLERLPVRPLRPRDAGRRAHRHGDDHRQRRTGRHRLQHRFGEGPGVRRLRGQQHRHGDHRRPARGPVRGRSRGGQRRRPSRRRGR